ncbi:MAG TPA: DUF72 domain-containing protein [Bryobacteraceae bacterium]|nr:DUF72 domain-containing protein [Bryobacteraceae bacterium]
MPLPRTLYCGPSGWSYPHWNGIVYPRLKPRGFHPLEDLSTFFDAVEINTSFYQPIQPELASLWVKKVANNPKFLFTVKLGRRFTHERSLRAVEIGNFKEGLWPIHRSRKLGCLLMQFPWSFRYTEENRAFVIALRRAFHEFPLVAEMRHSSWLHEEALGTLIDYRVGFANIDQAPYTKGMPPASLLTSRIGYVRLHGRNPQHWEREFGRPARATAAHDYLYSGKELEEWKQRVEKIQEHAATTFVFANNDAGGKSVVNALQLAQILGNDRRLAPAQLIEQFPEELADFRAKFPVQDALFAHYEREQRAVA